MGVLASALELSLPELLHLGLVHNDPEVAEMAL